MKEIYLDNSATTRICDAAKEKMLLAMECYGNPSSLHTVGQNAQQLLEEARRAVALSLGVRRIPEQGRIVFTSCGSEADQLALFGTAYAKERRRGGRIISTDSEHPAVENALRALESQGFEVVRISTKGGVLNFEQYAAALNEKVFLVTLMMVNNETGAVYDLSRAFRMAKTKNPEIVTHTDAVQGYMKRRFTPAALGADLISVSGHKIGAAKGVGALYLSPEALRRRDVVAVLKGGGQEDGFRSGTENTVCIAGFGAAAADGTAHLNEAIERMLSLRMKAETLLRELPVRLHLPTGERAPHILNFALPDIRSETMVHALSARGICVSGGSACSSHDKKLSRALLAFGVPEREVECSVRISLSKDNTEEEIRIFADALKEEIARLVRMR